MSANARSRISAGGTTGDTTAHGKVNMGRTILKAGLFLPWRLCARHERVIIDCHVDSRDVNCAGERCPCCANASLRSNDAVRGVWASSATVAS